VKIFDHLGKHDGLKGKEDFTQMAFTCLDDDTIDLPEDIFGDFTFQDITFFDCKSIKIHPNAFKSSIKTLETISLRKSGLTNEKGTLFALLRNHKNLNSIDLRDNKLTEIPAGSFLQLDKLKSIHLSGNEIESIGENPIPSLRFVDIAENKIKYLDEKVFAGFLDNEATTLVLDFLDCLNCGNQWLQKNSKKYHHHLKLVKCNEDKSKKLYDYKLRDYEQCK